MQRSCFLFGHADTPQFILPMLEQAIEREVERGTSVFYVGHHGNFDRLAATALRAVKRRHDAMQILLVLAYHPAEREVELPVGFDGTHYPPIEGVPRRYAILRANQYMLKMADSLICYVHHYGNTRDLLELAEKQAKKLRIENLAAEIGEFCVAPK